MYSQGREAERKIKGNKKDLEKTEKRFEWGRALDCEKMPVAQQGPAHAWFVDKQVWSQVRLLQPGLFSSPCEQGLPWPGDGDDHGV